MKVLVLNCGSSSLKYQLIDMSDESLLAIGICDRIGIDGSLITYTADGKDKITKEVSMSDHKAAVKYVLEALVDDENGVLGTLEELTAVGHRVVHGGEAFSSATIINDEVIKAIEDCIDLAPLHNPANLIGIKACQAIMPNKPQIAVFDTAFHQTMPKKSYIYALPYEYYVKHRLRRYGFHGTSHQYVSGVTAKILKRDIKEMKIIVCHLGNGASVCAVKNGKSVATSMGMTPLEGLVMGTRSGDIDPAIIKFIADKEDLTLAGVMDVLNKESGVKGISGISNDFRDIEVAINEGNKRAKLSMEVFALVVAKYIGAYAAVMNGVDAIAFTAGLGENNKEVRKMVCDYLGYLGVEIDDKLNDVKSVRRDFSTEKAKVRTLVVPTNEELAIGRETKKLLINI